MSRKNPAPIILPPRRRVDLADEPTGPIPSQAVPDVPDVAEALAVRALPWAALHPTINNGATLHAARSGTLSVGSISEQIADSVVAPARSNLRPLQPSKGYRATVRKLLWSLKMSRTSRATALTGTSSLAAPTSVRSISGDRIGPTVM